MLSKFAAAAMVAASLVSAQTFTDCNPMEKTCPNDKAVGSKPITVDFTKGKNDFFKELEGTTLTYAGEDGAEFVISKDTQAPTIASTKFIFYGQVDVVARAAPGAGIITSLVLQSDDLDEIDWEWVGSDDKQVQTNYFSKGCDKVFDRGTYEAVANPQAEYHTYTLKWTPTELQWIINGAVVRSLKAAGLSGCSGYPQTPMQIKIGTWVAGRKGAPDGTVQWAGGLANFADAPFVAHYKSVTITDYMGGDGTPGSGATEATEYQYTDNSGTSGSIKVIGGSGSGSDKTTTKSATKTASGSKTETTLSTVTSSSSSSSSTPSDADASTTASESSGAGPSQTGASPTSPTSSAGTAPTSGADKMAMPLGMGVAALFGALLL
ncbi:concanavalin A-like lectin/glucanase domain-containing protein [Apodospora peruviana]|uniref:Crh-like protein n=1 Tax=Apodospora peruviana TaxID=516989 RepID=A0AAE0M249_9PEZI|nr:concanavalin A-like lectin/glucanase domain-containing protein [Apodospora peruviana]